MWLSSKEIQVVSSFTFRTQIWLLVMAGAAMHWWFVGSLIDAIGLYSIMCLKDKRILQSVSTHRFKVHNFSCEISTEY